MSYHPVPLCRTTEGALRDDLRELALDDFAFFGWGCAELLVGLQRSARTSEHPAECTSASTYATRRHECVQSNEM